MMNKVVTAAWQTAKSSIYDGVVLLMTIPSTTTATFVEFLRGPVSLTAQTMLPYLMIPVTSNRRDISTLEILAVGANKRNRIRRSQITSSFVGLAVATHSLNKLGQRITLTPEP